MTNVSRSRLVLSITAVLVLSIAPATFGQWALSGPMFDASGDDLNGFFGTPFIGGANMDTLIFSNFQFSVSAPAGGSQSKNDTVTIDVTVPAGFTINRIQTVVTGDYLIIGEDGQTGSMVDLTSGIVVTELNGLQRVLTNEAGVCDFGACDLIGNPAPFPRQIAVGQIPPFEQNQFSGLAEVDMTGLFQQPATMLRVELSMASIAQAVIEGSATLNTNLAQQQLEIKLIPEPASIALIGLGLAPLAIRRRRVRR
jgi:hypothetical protein